MKNRKLTYGLQVNQSFGGLYLAMFKHVVYSLWVREIEFFLDYGSSVHDQLALISGNVLY